VTERGRRGVCVATLTDHRRRPSPTTSPTTPTPLSPRALTLPSRCPHALTLSSRGGVCTAKLSSKLSLNNFRRADSRRCARPVPHGNASQHATPTPCCAASPRWLLARMNDRPTPPRHLRSPNECRRHDFSPTAVVVAPRRCSLLLHCVLAMTPTHIVIGYCFMLACVLTLTVRVVPV
jgi:hypothetical protein